MVEDDVSLLITMQIYCGHYTEDSDRRNIHLLASDGEQNEEPLTVLNRSMQSTGHD